MFESKKYFKPGERFVIVLLAPISPFTRENRDAQCEPGHFFSSLLVNALYLNTSYFVYQKSATKYRRRSAVET